MNNSNSHSNKRLKPITPIVRLTSRVSNHETKKQLTRPPPPIVRFINKTTESTVNSTSPTSSSSTLSSPLTKNSLQQVTNLFSFRSKFFGSFFF